MAGLAAPPAQVSGIRVFEAAVSGELPIALDVALFNPSDLEIALGGVTLAVSLTACPGGVAFGEVTLEGLVLRRGWNRLHADGAYQDREGSCGPAFLSGYVNGEAANLTLRGLRSDVPLIQGFLSAFDTTVLAPGIGASALMSEARILLLDPLPVLESGLLHTTVTLSNPMLATAEILAASLTMEYHDSRGQPQTLGRLDFNVSGAPILVPGLSSMTSPVLCVRLTTILSPLLIRAFLKAAASPTGAPIWLRGRATLRVGDRSSAVGAAGARQASRGSRGRDGGWAARHGNDDERDGRRGRLGAGARGIRSGGGGYKGAGGERRGVEVQLDLQQGPVSSRIHLVSPPPCLAHAPASYAHGPLEEDWRRGGIDGFFWKEMRPAGSGAVSDAR